MFCNLNPNASKHGLQSGKKTLITGLGLFLLIGWLAANNHVLCSWANGASGEVGEEQNVGFSCLTCLFRLFVRTLISLTNAFAGCGRPTLNFIERF